MLEEGKIYLVKTSQGCVWLFKKRTGRFIDKITGCNSALCLDDMFKCDQEGYVCNNSEIEYCKPANENYIAMWNRVFNDSIEME